MLSRKYFVIAVLVFPSYGFAQETKKGTPSENQPISSSSVSVSNKNTHDKSAQERQKPTGSANIPTASSSNAETYPNPERAEKRVFHINYVQSEKVIRTDRHLRVLLEVLLGTLGNAGVFGSLYAALPWAWHRESECEKEGGEDCGLGPTILTMFAIPAGVITSFTTPLGVYLGGKSLEGNGSYWLTTLGHLAGMAVGFGTAFLLRDVEWDSDSNFGSEIPTLAIATVMQLTGAILAYELSNDAYEKRTLGESSQNLTLLPFATLTNQGGIVGVGATF